MWEDIWTDLEFCMKTVELLLSGGGVKGGGGREEVEKGKEEEEEGERERVMYLVNYIGADIAQRIDNPAETALRDACPRHIP